MDDADSQAMSDSYTVLVTGANSGLGFDICRRVIDEFLSTRPPSQSLVLIITTRSQKKGTDTLNSLRRHTHALSKGTSSGHHGNAVSRVQLRHEVVDLLSLLSVRSLIRTLLASTSKIDAIILNAGMGGWTGLNWPSAIYNILTDFIPALTWPTYKISSVGSVAQRQLPDYGKVTAKKEPKLGKIFCANVFGHYMLAHGVMSLLAASSAGRIIWISSLEAYANAFAPGDLQSIFAPMPYEGSKRLTDILAITSALPATAPWTESYFRPEAAQLDSKPNRAAAGAAVDGPSSGNRPKIYVCHPGICATSIMPLPLILQYAMVAAMYVARWLGSIWHTCDSYLGACAAVWLALQPQRTLDSMETLDGPGKWGSAVDVRGNERVERTEMEGWGYGGIEGDSKKGGWARSGRKRGAKDLTKEAREEFEHLGRVCWKEMERLRVQWTTLLDEAEASK